ncbi:MAG: hypothetical protein QNI98_09010 [Woeseiaceae bacterium]|nr:hypothetical protein [Woeseiaceae bacterium]
MGDDDNGATYNVESHNQSGGITAGRISINLQPGWRKLEERPVDWKLMCDVIAAYPNHPVKFIVPAGDAEAMTYAMQFRKAYKRNGLEVQEFIHEGMGGDPLPPLSYCLEADKGREWVLIQVGNRNSPTRPTGKA